MPRHELTVPTSRIETLTDGIFAIAMTLLVLGIQVPTLQGTITPLMFRVRHKYSASDIHVRNQFHPSGCFFG